MFLDKNCRYTKYQALAMKDNAGVPAIQLHTNAILVVLIV
jgi:hypothetical protein